MNARNPLSDRRLAIVTPLVLLIIMVTFAQLVAVPRWLTAYQGGSPTSESGAGAMQLLGYNFNHDLAEVSVSLWNRGSTPITITNITYDGSFLKRGIVGLPNDLTGMPGMGTGASHPPDLGNGSEMISANDIIFSASDTWNMYTGGPSEPVIQPNHIATLYLGVSSTTPGTVHTLVILSGTQQYVFQIKR